MHTTYKKFPSLAFQVYFLPCHCFTEPQKIGRSSGNFMFYQVVGYQSVFDRVCYDCYVYQVNLGKC